jgi:hypothetical protein
MRLGLSSKLIRAYCEDQGWETPSEGTTFVFALRNASPVPGEVNTVFVHEPRPDQWDDTIGVGGEQWALFRGTTDPGAPYTRDPMNEDGAAWVVPGSYWFKIGFHKLPWNWALVEDSDVTIRRDRDRDGKPEYGEKVYRGRFGIHVHVGGFLAAVGRWSAGCLVIVKQQWGAFKRLLLKSGQRKFLVVVIDARLFARWVREQ